MNRADGARLTVKTDFDFHFYCVKENNSIKSIEHYKLNITIYHISQPL